MDKYYITHKAFKKIFSSLSGKKEIYCNNRERTQMFMEGVYFTRTQRQELVPYYGKFKNVHKRFLSWAKKDMWNDILSFFAQDCDIESVMIEESVAKGSCVCQRYSKKNKL